jgi:pimeloyl-ACP methyl ester carboxylesterase
MPASRLVAFVVCAVILVGCASELGDGSASSRHLDGWALTPCTISGDLPIRAEAEALCGTLTVPEDPFNPGGRQIDLRVAVVPALASDPSPDPLFVLAGGPGDAATRFFAWLPGLYADVHARRDIVLVDQRGTGDSNALILPPVPDTTGLSVDQADTLLSAWAGDGLAALDADPRMYTSTVAADDLEAVRIALGYDKIDLYGASYGGELAQYYLRQHGDHVRVAIMDGSTPLDVPVLEQIAANSDRAMNLLLSRCAEDSACHAAFPDVSNEWSALVAAFRQGVPVTDPATGEQRDATLADVGPSIHNALLTEAGAANLPLAIHLAAQGQLDRVNELVPSVEAAPASSPLLMKHMILCSEAWARWDPSQVARRDPGGYAVAFQTEWAESEAALCEYLPKGIVPADDGAPVVTDVPILWLTGDGDPQDPPANLSNVSDTQANCRVGVMPAHEHVVGHLGCAPSLIAAFLESGSTTDLDYSCLAEGSGAFAFTIE